MKGYRVLLVDDEELALAGMEHGVDWPSLLVGHIYKADSLKSAKEIMRRHPIDLMVSDIEMPGGSGLELIRWVKKEYPQTVSIPSDCLHNGDLPCGFFLLPGCDPSGCGGLCAEADSL